MALVVLTGGVRSGKSALAERLAAERGGEVVAVVFADGEGDPEMADRIARHRERRPGGWRVVEAGASAGWLGEVPGDVLLLLDCLGTLAGRVMAEAWEELAAGGFSEAREAPTGYADEVERRLGAVTDALIARDGDTLVVTNEVGDGVVPAHATGRVFRDALGRANRALVANADAAWLVVAGRCVDLTALPREARWPTE